MTDYDIYKVEPKNNDLPAFLLRARDEQEALSNASGSYNSSFIVSNLANGNANQVHMIDLYYSDPNNVSCQKLQIGNDYTDVLNISENQCSIIVGDKMYVLSDGIATKVTDFN